ncbi:MAG TPA: glycine cleavage system protein H [Bryobacteraceae bacterium]|jgi:glycine cleavage system H lipoate-binding protein
MTVILVLVTFFGFVVLDWLLHRGKAPAVASAVEPSTTFQIDRISGFLAPDNLRYHAGHSWLLRERRNIARTGADEFAAALAGGITSIELPKPGQWVRQGQKAWTLHRNGETTEMVSPIEGEVIEVNQEVLKNPALLRDDPYGRGWLMTVNVPDEETTTRNLVPRDLVRNWMRSAVEQLYSLQPQAAYATAADGGEPARDLLAGTPELPWQKVTRQFFMTAE